MNKYSEIEREDGDIYNALVGEERRQVEGIELIPSENFTSLAVREALGSCMTNKYSEGYPGKRYYGGQEFSDIVESLAIERACKLFKCKYANVQPHSGAPANLAVYTALLEPGDTVLGMDLSHGGHLTHGHPVTLPAKIFKFCRYGMKDIDTGEIDYDKLRETALKEKPKIILAGFSSYSRNLDWQKFKEIAGEVGAITVADIAHISGLIAGGVLENPFDHGFDVMTSTTHKTLRGPRGGMILVRENKEYIVKINKAVFPGMQGGPHMNNIAAKAICFKEALEPDFKKYAKQILLNAKAMEDVFKTESIKMISGGTDNHLILIDTVKSFNMSGKDAQDLLEQVGITVNKNVLPDDGRGPVDPSGIRLGTPAMTTRGMKEEESKEVAQIVVECLRSQGDNSKLNKLKSESKSLASRF